MPEVDDLVNCAVHQLFTYHEDMAAGGLSGVCEKLQKFPDHPKAMCLICALQVMSGLWHPESCHVKPYLKKLESLLFGTKHLSKIDELHVSAMLNYGNGLVSRAIADWWSLVRACDDDNIDLMAAQCIFYACLNIGDFKTLLEAYREIYDRWTGPEHLKPGIRAKLAFAIEESGTDYELAEEHCKEVLLAEPSCGWALHTLSHVYYETGRLDQGLTTLDTHRHAVCYADLIYGHNTWHKALFHFEKGEFEAVLSAFDDVVEPRLSRDVPDLLDLTDASSLLKRLELVGVSVGDRWNAVYEYCSDVIEQHASSFVDSHIMLALMSHCPKQGDKFLAGMELSSRTRTPVTRVPNAEEDDGEGDGVIAAAEFSHKATMAEVGTPLCRGIAAYHAQEYSAAADLLLPLGTRLLRLGGSGAQRDVFDLVTINACILSCESRHNSVVKNLLYERRSRQQEVCVTGRMTANLLAKH